VGIGSPPRRDVAGLSDRVAEGYRGAGSAWAADAALVYRPLARHLVAASPTSFDGALVLDAGAGTGLAGDEARRLGARVVATDRQQDMLKVRCGQVSAVADVDRLPFRSGVFDAVVAAFVLNHLDRPLTALSEFARVTRPAGSVLASTFSAHRADAKALVDEVIIRHGWQPPPWYVEVHRCAQAVGTADRVARLARRAGLTVLDVADAEIDVGLHHPEQIVRARLGMPQIAPFVASLTSAARDALVRDAVAVVERESKPFLPRVIELVAVSPDGPTARA